MKVIAFIPWLGLVYVGIVFGWEVDFCSQNWQLIMLLVIFLLDVMQLSSERSARLSVMNMFYSVLYIGLIVLILSKELMVYDVNSILLIGLTLIEVVLTIIIGKDLARLNFFAEKN